MKLLKTAMTLVLTSVLLMGTVLNVNAEEENSASSNYVPNENSDLEVIDISGRVLQSGDKVVIGDYTVEY